MSLEAVSFSTKPKPKPKMAPVKQRLIHNKSWKQTSGSVTKLKTSQTNEAGMTRSIDTAVQDATNSLAHAHLRRVWSGTD